MPRTISARQWLLTFCVFLACGALVPMARANPVLGEILPLRQPDGTLIQTRIWGDEFYTVVESLDGYTLVRDPATQVICYARLSDDCNSLVSTHMPAGQGDPLALGLTPHMRINPNAAAAQARAARADFERRQAEGPLAPLRGDTSRGPTNGNVVGLCLIIDFSDDEATIQPYAVDAYCNQVGYTGYGNNGSVRDYYYDVSNHYLTYTNYVPPSYYRAQHPKTYYNDTSIPYGQRARELIVEALTYLDANGLNFAQFDADHNGVVDALNCYYAGYSNSAWAEGLWPHSSSVYFAADGVHTNSYQISDMQDALHLSTFCHENGHMLMGWPDLYDYDYDSTGVGRFCIMCYGTSATNPCQPCAYMKYKAGWAATTVLTSAQMGLVVPSGNANVVFKFPHPTRFNEYYLIENRQRIGRDSGLPDDGLAIWHIDTYGSNNNQQQTPASHYLVTLVQADGRWDLEHNRNYGDATDLWAAPSYTQCTPSTSPNTDWWDGSASGLFFTNISGSGDTMTFDFGQDCNHNGVSDALDISGGTSQDCNGNGIPDECEVPPLGPAVNDCNGNGIPDSCDIAGGLSPDCNGNGKPDECEVPPLGPPSNDCNGNGVPDSCDIAGGLSPDCNGNGIPDQCDLASLTSLDCNNNGIPDECESDLNNNAVPESCELSTPTGLIGTYYDGPNFTGIRRGRFDAAVDFNWDTGAPWPGFGGDSFSVRWTGYVKTTSARGMYTFYTRTSDGVRLWVKGQPLINEWIDQESTEWAQSIFLQSDSVYRIVLEYYHNVSSQAIAQLNWQPPGGAYATVPPANLAPSNDCNGNGVPDDIDIALGTVTDANGNGMPDLCERRAGDMNCDDIVNYADVNPFILALTSQTAYSARYPNCNWTNADCNRDGSVNYADINAFVVLLNQ